MRAHDLVAMMSDCLSDNAGSIPAERAS
jgi:hypothetical protein